MKTSELRANQRVRVVQTVQERTDSWAIQVEGTIVELSLQPTGAWHAHGKNDKLWLQRLRLAKDDGEIVDLILDDASVVTPL